MKALYALTGQVNNSIRPVYFPGPFPQCLCVPRDESCLAGGSAAAAEYDQFVLFREKGFNKQSSEKTGSPRNNYLHFFSYQRQITVIVYYIQEKL